jgi:hypothetical protein
VIYYPLAEIVHLHGASSQKLSGAALAGRKAKLIYFDKTRGPVAAWCGNLIMSAGTILRTPFWLFAYLLKGRAGGGGRSVFLGRIELLRFHLAGLFKPVWKQAPAGHEKRQAQT